MPSNLQIYAHVCTDMVVLLFVMIIVQTTNSFNEYCNIIMDITKLCSFVSFWNHLQCFDTLGWAAGRASGL